MSRIKFHHRYQSYHQTKFVTYQHSLTIPFTTSLIISSQQTLFLPNLGTYLPLTSLSTYLLIVLYLFKFIIYISVSQLLNISFTLNQCSLNIYLRNIYIHAHFSINSKSQSNSISTFNLLQLS